MFDKNLQDLVRGIRNHKEDEVRRRRLAAYGGGGGDVKGGLGHNVGDSASLSSICQILSHKFPQPDDSDVLRVSGPSAPASGGMPAGCHAN